MPRIHYSFDGTQVWYLNDTTHTKVLAGADFGSYGRAVYCIDGDLSQSQAVPNTSNAWLFNFPNVLTISKISIKANSSFTATVYKSTDTTDGTDGTWTEIASEALTAYNYQDITFTPTDTQWIKILTVGVTSACFAIHIFGDYQSPLFELWDNGESAKFSADYPLALANAPNNVDYHGHLQFKLKNTDTGTHSYSLTIKAMRWNTNSPYYADSVISSYYTLSVDGGSTKVTTVTITGLGADSFSGTIDLYGDVVKANNPIDGKHYFAVDITVTA